MSRKNLFTANGKRANFKRATLALALALLFVQLTPPAAKADDCKSLAQVTGDIWQKWGAVIAAVGCGVAAAAGVVKPKTCLSSAQYAEAVDKMVDYFNEKANNGWATIGPRRIDFGSTQEGTLIGPGERVFLSPAPLDKDSVTIHVKKLGGKGKSTVVVCKIDENNVQTKLEEFEFAEGDDNTGQEITKTVSGVSNRLLQVHLAGKSLTREFHYSFNASK
jgi:hypothetical protein